MKMFFFNDDDDDDDDSTKILNENELNIQKASGSKDPDSDYK